MENTPDVELESLDGAVFLTLERKTKTNTKKNFFDGRKRERERLGQEQGLLHYIVPSLSRAQSPRVGVGEGKDGVTRRHRG